MGDWSDGTPVTELEVFPQVTGIDGPITPVISFYPNPAYSSIYFEKEVANLSLLNLEGKVVLTGENVQKINISNIATGVYLLKIDNTFQKLIIQ